MRLGATVGAPAVAFALKTSLEYGSGVVAGVGVGQRCCGDGQVDCRRGLLLLDGADTVTAIADPVRVS